MNKKKKRKGFERSRMRCPYCGSSVVYRSADEIYRDNSKGTMLYVCSRYPECDSYVRVHAGTNIPVGSMANHELRTLRRTAHRYFDQLYESGYMSKQDAYQFYTSRRLIQELGNANCIFLSCIRQLFTITKYEAMISI